jgi:thioredoxin-related protein
VSAQNVVFGQCSLHTIKVTPSKSASGVVAIFSQEGCPYCPIAVDIAKRSIGGKIPIMQMPLEKGPCLDLATKYRVKDTPTIIYFDKHGRERKSGFQFKTKPGGR